VVGWGGVRAACPMVRKLGEATRIVSIDRLNYKNGREVISRDTSPRQDGTNLKTNRFVYLFLGSSSLRRKGGDLQRRG